MRPRAGRHNCWGLPMSAGGVCKWRGAMSACVDVPGSAGLRVAAGPFGGSAVPMGGSSADDGCHEAAQDAPERCVDGAETMASSGALAFANAKACAARSLLASPCSAEAAVAGAAGGAGPAGATACSGFCTSSVRQSWRLWVLFIPGIDHARQLLG